MTNIFNKSVILSAIAALAATAVSCSSEEPATGERDSRRIEVRIAAPAAGRADIATRAGEEGLPVNPTVVVGTDATAQALQPRMAFEDDGLTLRWTKGDRIALWGYAGGSAAFENEPFTLWYPREDPSQGLFTGKIDAMAAGTYDYYAACPIPDAAAGTKVSYTVPEVQNGRWNSDLDIMLAKAAGAELREEILNDVTLRFQHKMHALKVTIPAGKNLLGRPIEKLRIEFGRPVAGRLTWDLSDPDAAPEHAQTATGITLAFDTPVDESDTFWVFLAPADLTGGEVRFVATDGTEYSWPLSTWNFRDCTAGSITPVKLTIDELRPQQDYTVTVDPTHLGEAVTQIDSLTMPAGYEFPSLELLNKTRDIAANGDGTFRMKIFNDQKAGFANGIEVGLGVGSENAEGVYGKRCAVSAATADGCTVMSPYLFFEDFSETIPVSNYADDNGANGYELIDAGLPGWTGSRWKTDQQSLEFRSYQGNSNLIGWQDNKYGRVDTPSMPLRSGKTVTLSVSYDIGSTSNSQCTFGTTTQGGPIGGGHGHDNRTLPDNTVETFKPDASGSPTHMPTYKQHTIGGCMSATRLTWCGEYSASGMRQNAYFYMDNVRVTIVH